MKKFILIIPLLFQFLCVRADFGCVVPGEGILLVSQTSDGAPYANKGALVPPPGCFWELRVYDKGCAAHGKSGIRGEFELQCPLDNNVLALIIFTAMAGVYYLQRKEEL